MRRALAILAAALLLPAGAWAGATAAKFPTTCVSYNTCTTSADCPSSATCSAGACVSRTAWSSAGNAVSSNNSRASVSLAASGQSQWLKCTTYGLTTGDIGDDKIVKGIVAQLEVQQSGATIQVQDIRAIKADGTISAISRATGSACIGAWTASDTIKTCGSSSDLWGESWSPADVRDSDFGIAVSVKNTNASTSRTASIDAVSLLVYYSPPSGRVFATGFDSYGAEDGTGVNASYIAGAARTGSLGLRLSAAAADTSATWQGPASLDADIVDRVYGRWYWPTTPTLPTGRSIVVASVKQDGEIGCYLTLSLGDDGCFGYQVRYHGREPADLDFGTFAATSSPSVTCSQTLAGQAVELGQVLGGNSVACPLYINAQPIETFALALNAPDNCAANTCDIAGFTLGTPATGSVEDYSGFPAFTLDYDDFVIDNLSPIGTGYVRALFPSSDASLGWSNLCSSSGWACLDDWASGTEDACSSSSDTRQKTSGTGTDLFNLADISPTLGASDSVAAVRGMAACCTTNAANAEGITLHWKSGTTDQTTPEQTISTTAATRWSYTFANNFISGEPAWTESTVNSLQLGYDRSTPGSANARCSALMAYVDVKTPAPAADRTLQDWNGAGGVPDGTITVVTGCDSITAGTKTSVCLSIDGTKTANNPGGACQAPCTSDLDCDGGTCGVTGVCAMACETTADCTCGDQAICATGLNWVNQFSAKVPQVDNLINCGRNTMPSQWWADVLSDIIPMPASHAPPCQLIRGAWGHCSSVTTTTCATDTDCPPDNTCVPYAVDYVVDMCGGNEAINYLPSDCAGNSFTFPEYTDRWNVPACPRAVATPTPGAWQVARRTCTTNADCTGAGGVAAGYGPGSACKGACAGHTDPVWSCNSEADCGECEDDPTRRCGHQGQCISDGILQSEWCNDDSDCSVGTCSSYESRAGSYDDAYGTCGACLNRSCDTATKYCTPLCSAISCSTDADCQPPGVLGGVCDTGTGKCASCGSGTYYDLSTPSLRALNAHRLARSPGGLTQDAIAAKEDALTASIRALGAQRVAATYARSFLVKSDVGMHDEFQAIARTKLRDDPIVVDAHHAAPYYDDRVSGQPYGALLLFDGIHNLFQGASVTSQLIAASVNALYPVCSGDTADLCGFCDVSCGADADCHKPVVGTSPTPTPKAGACRTATPGVKACGCTTDADCGAGCACEDVDGGAGTDKRCVCEAISSCPAGDNTSARKRTASDALCASGTCTEERVPPLCTMSKARCTTTADCLGYARGDICAADGVWQPCQNNADCTRDGGKYADPVCAPGTPVVGTSPTPKSRVCQAPTPTVMP